MRKKASLILICFIAVILAGCSKKLDVDKNTVYVQKKGGITGVTIEKLDKDYYSGEELEGYVEERVADYISEHEEKSVSVDKFEMTDDDVKLTMKYAGYADYASFNEVEIYSGTVPEALAEGYDLDVEVAAVEEGKLGGTVNALDIMEDSNYKIVILSEKIDVMVDGDILYVSAENTSLTGKDTVKIEQPKDAPDGEEAGLTYIIYE